MYQINNKINIAHSHNSTIFFQDHCCILHTIVGWHSSVGEWTRVEGTPQDPNPNKPFAKLDIPELFNDDGRLNPSITVIGQHLHYTLVTYKSVKCLNVHSVCNMCKAFIGHKTFSFPCLLS